MSSIDKIVQFIRLNPESQVKQIAAGCELSESRTRELLKTPPAGVESRKEGKATVYWTPDVKAEKVSAKKDGVCPLCGAGGEDQSHTHPGVAKCNKCGKSYSIFTGTEVSAGVKGADTRKGPINPQPKIDAIKAAVQEHGGEMTYGKRSWIFTGMTKVPLEITSAELGEFKRASDFLAHMGWGPKPVEAGVAKSKTTERA